jgi:hypothetical protein
MVQRVLRSPRALIVLSFGIVLGAVWAAGSAASAAPKPGQGVSITAGDGLLATPNNPITSSGTLSVNYGGTGVATSVARSDHQHSEYLPLSGGTLGGNLTLGGGAQLIGARVENAAQPPANAQPGQLFWNTAAQSLQVFDGLAWQTVSGGGGGAGPSILGVSRPPYQLTTSFAALDTTTASVTFTLPSDETVVLEFGGEYEMQSASAFVVMSLTPYVDNVGPPFPGDTALFQEFSRFNQPDRVLQCSKLVTRSLTAGTHAVHLKASINGNSASATIRNIWLKVSK